MSCCRNKIQQLYNCDLLMNFMCSQNLNELVCIHISFLFYSGDVFPTLVASNYDILNKILQLHLKLMQALFIENGI